MTVESRQMFLTKTLRRPKMERKTTLHIQIDELTKRKYKVLCTLDNWTIQQRTEYLVKEWIKLNEYKITGLDK